jgi:type I restriction enzyme, S subunit
MDSLIGPVPDDWTERRLEEICEILPGPSPGGIDLKDRESVEDPIVPVVTPKDMRHNRIDDDWTVGIAEEAARRLPPRYRLVLDDIVCSRTGQLGRQALVGENQRGWILGPACLLVRVREMVQASYLVYYFGHPAVRDWIVRNTGGAVIPSLSTKMLGSLPVVVPSAEVQADMADVLGALDEKIIVHEQISRTTAALRDAVLPQLLREGKPGEPG